MPVGPTPEQLKALGFAPPGGTGSATPDQAKLLGFDTPEPAAPQQAVQEPGFFDKLKSQGGFSGLLDTAKGVVSGEPGMREGFAQGAGEAIKTGAPTAVRMGSGILGAEGGLTGAGIAGGGEGLAQLLEGKFDPARIAVAGGIGAVPFGSVVKQGRVGASALRSGALAGGGETAREALSGESFSPRSVGTATAMGAVGGAGGSKLATMFGASPKLGKGESAAGGAVSASEKEASLAARAKQRLSDYERNLPANQKANAKAADAAENEWYDVKDAGEKFHSQSAATARKQSQKTAQETAEQARINEQIAAEGRVPGEATISENAAGKKRMSTPFKAPKEAEETGGIEFTPEEYARFNEPEPVAPGQPQSFRDLVYQEAGREAPPLPAPKPKFEPLPIDEGESIGDYIRRNGVTSIDTSAEEALANQAKAAAPPAPTPTAVVEPEIPAQSKSDFLQSPEVQAILQGAAPEEKAAQNPLATLFKSRAGAAGANYGAAKTAEKAGEIGSADLAHEAFARERAALGQSTKPRGQGPKSKPTAAAPVEAGTPTPVAPDVTPGIGTGPTGDWVKDQSTLAETALQDPNLRASLLKRAQEEKGLAAPGLQQVLGGVSGAAVGAPIGAYGYGEDDDYGALKGALMGGALGAGVMSPTGRGPVNNALNLRASSMLSSPNTMAKSYLGDAGGHFWEGVKQLITPGQAQYGKDILGQHALANPVQWGKDVLTGLKQTTPARSAMGSGQQASPNSLLDLVYRPLSASNYATEQAMGRAGVPQQVAERISGVSDPQTQALKQLVALQGQNPMFRAMWPFLRVASNIAEGSQNIPGISLKYGNPADKWQRTAVGGMQMGLGAGSEMYDQSQAEAGNPTGNLTKALRANVMGIQGTAPYAAGYGLSAALGDAPATAIRELLQLLPGSQATFSPPYPGESSQEYLLRVGGKMGGSMIPSLLKPDPGTVR